MQSCVCLCRLFVHTPKGRGEGSEHTASYTATSTKHITTRWTRSTPNQLTLGILLLLEQEVALAGCHVDARLDLRHLRLPGRQLSTYLQRAGVFMSCRRIHVHVQAWACAYKQEHRQSHQHRRAHDTAACPTLHPNNVNTRTTCPHPRTLLSCWW